MNALSPWQQRLLALALLLLVLLGLGGGLTWALTAAFTHYRQPLEEDGFRLQRFLQTAARKDALQQQVERLRQQHQAQGYLLAHTTPALASADLQQRVSALVAQHGGQLRSTQVAPVQLEENYARIGIRVQMTGALDTLLNLFYELEAGRPLLQLDNIRITPQRRRRFRHGQEQAEPAVMLNINFDLIGYMRAPA